MTTKGIHVGFKPIPTLISLFISLLIWFIIPVPSGVDPNAWHLLAIFVGVIAAIIWLIGISIMISKGLQKTGLGARLGYLFIAVWGKKTIGIGYSMVLSELILAPVTPSNTARGGGIIHPIVRAISTSYDSDPVNHMVFKCARNRDWSFRAKLDTCLFTINACLFVCTLYVC